MEVDSGSDLLTKVASGGPVDDDVWPGLRSDILSRLDKIAHNDFPIPTLPPPPPPPDTARLASPLGSTPLEEQSSQEANKENAPVQRPAAQPLEPGQLPKQIADMLADIAAHLDAFAAFPPHTVQRLAELVLSPRAHYKALASYLHAVDRVVQVTSATDIYPLPPAVPDMSLMTLNGDTAPDDAATDPAAAVSWGNPANASVGSDEALGGALLTPIPWIARRSPEGSNASDGAGSGGSGDSGPGAQIHSESTETIDGPNGMGSIETVSVSVNGVPSTGHARGITQGELLRQEQRAGVVPVSQLTRSSPQGSGGAGGGGGAAGAGGEEERPAGAEDDEERAPDEEADEDEVPHARGPEEIGVDDTGPQGPTTSYMGEGGVETQDIDVEAAVGRRHADEDAPEGGADGDSGEGDASAEEQRQAAEGPAAQSPGAESAGTKREAEQALEPETTKKIKEDDGSVEEAKTEEAARDSPGDDAGDKTEGKEAGQGDEMETDN